MCDLVFVYDLVAMDRRSRSPLKKPEMKRRNLSITRRRRLSVDEGRQVTHARSKLKMRIMCSPYSSIVIINVIVFILFVIDLLLMGLYLQLYYVIIIIIVIV